MHRTELVKLSSPPLQLTFNKWKTKKLQKSETCLFVDVSTLTKINGILFTVGNVDREISVDIAVDIAVDTRSIVGRHSVDTWSTLGR